MELHHISSSLLEGNGAVVDDDDAWLNGGADSEAAQKCNGKHGDSAQQLLRLVIGRVHAACV